MDFEAHVREALQRVRYSSLRLRKEAEQDRYPFEVLRYWCTQMDHPRRAWAQIEGRSPMCGSRLRMWILGGDREEIVKTGGETPQRRLDEEMSGNCWRESTVMGPEAKMECGEEGEARKGGTVPDSN